MKTITVEIKPYAQVALAAAGASTLVNIVASRVLLKRFEELEARYKVVWEAGRYMLNIIERSEIELTEFDNIALETIMTNPPKNVES